METTIYFFSGFFVAGLVGWISSFIVKKQAFKNCKRKRLLSKFHEPSQEIAQKGNDNEIKTKLVPKFVHLLKQGCSNILVLISLPVVMLTAISTIVFALQREAMPAFLLGVIFAPIAGFVFGQYHVSWSVLQNLYNRIRYKVKGKKFEKWLALLWKTLFNIFLFFGDEEDLNAILFDDDILEKSQRINLLKRRIIRKSRHLNKLNDKRALFGELHVPPHILIEIEDKEAELEELKAKLDSLNSNNITPNS